MNISDEMKANQLNMMKFMSEIESDYIVSMIEAIHTKDYLFFVMEYCEGGNLLEYLNKNPYLEFDE
jgi:serine/threonine protein kinase